MSYYTRQQNRRRSEATEQETLIQWCGWQQSKCPELKLIYHIPNGGSRNTLEAANLKRQGYYTAVCYGAEEAETVIAGYLQMAGYPALEQAGKGE